MKVLKHQRLSVYFEESGKPKNESLKASASFILRKGVIFHFKGSGKSKDESLKASASFILKEAENQS